MRISAEVRQAGNAGRRAKVNNERGVSLPSSVLGHSSAEMVPNVLAYDVEYWANWILERAKEKIGHLYPPGKDGKPVIGYLGRAPRCARIQPASQKSRS